VLIDEFNLADCGVLIVDQASGQLRRLARRGSYTVRATAPLLLDGAGLTVEAVRTGTAVYSPDVTADPRYVPNEPRTRSELAVPLRSGGQVIGVLDLQSDRLDGFDARARRLIDAFADQVALAVANVLLLERLDEARQAAEESNQIKSEFLANTSHELRTPLTAILGSLNLLLNDEVDDAEQGKHFAQIAHDAATNLLRIVNDLLDIARIEAGRIELSLKPVDVAGALAEAYMLMWVQADAKRLSLDMQIPAEPIAVRADAARLGQILINLIGNAIKFTAEGKVSVTVEADRTSGLARIQVLDTGIGVAPDKQPRLFEPFVAAIRALRPGRRHKPAQVRRHGPGAFDLASPGRDDGRHPRVDIARPRPRHGGDVDAGAGVRNRRDDPLLFGSSTADQRSVSIMGAGHGPTQVVRPFSANQPVCRLHGFV